MNFVVQGIVWALVTFYGPAQITGSIYTTRAACEQQLLNLRFSCTPQLDQSCTTGPQPLMKCIQMDVPQQPVDVPRS